MQDGEIAGAVEFLLSGNPHLLLYGFFEWSLTHLRRTCCANYGIIHANE